MKHSYAAFFLPVILHMLGELAPAALGDVGTAAAYGPPYIPTQCNGYNQDQFPASNMFAAVSDGLWDNGAACGRWYMMRCLSGPNRPCRDGSIVVQVVDRCAEPCPAVFHLSTAAFSALSRSSSARINVEYTEDGSIAVQVVDRCAEPCPAVFHLSTAAFSALSRSSSARINVEYTEI